MKRFNGFISLVRENFKLFEIVALIIIMISAAVFLYLKDNGNNVTLEEVESESSMLTDNGSVKKEEAASGKSGGPVYVDISGEVVKQGVYEVKEGSRVFDVIELAGGTTEKADVTQINRAETVTDGQKIIIPRKGAREDASQSASSSSNAGAEETGTININTADAAALQDIPGVGEVTAGKIIDYRNEHGPFARKEDIKNISGIGDKTFEKMKEFISV